MRNPRIGWRIGLVGLAALLTLLAHIAYFREIAGSTLLQVPQLDAADYQERALALLQGQGWPARPFWQGPLYPVVLAVLYAVFGAASLAPQLLQGLLTLLAPLLVFLVARRLAGTGAALAAAVLYALYGPPLFYAGFLLPAVLLTVLVLLFTYLCLRMLADGSWRPALGAGLVLGAAALLRGNVLLLVLAPLLLLRGMKAARQVALRRATVFVLGVAACVLPVTARNLFVGHDLVLISSNFGLNLWIGQQSEYGGIFGPVHLRPEQDYDPTGQKQLEMELGRELKPSEVSRIYARRALRRILQEPGEMLLHYLRKAYRFWNGYELPQVASYDRQRARAPVLRLLPVPFVLLSALGLLGMLRSRTREERLVALIVGLYFLSLLPFFPTARYRQPVAPLLAVLAVLVLRDATARWRAGDRRGLARILVPALALLVLLWPTWARLDPARVEWRSLMNEASRETRLGHAEQTQQLLQRADATLPGQATTFYYAGLLFEQLGEDSNARRAFARAADLAPEEALPLYRLGRVLDRLDRRAEALAAFRRSEQLDPAWDKPHFGEAMVLRDEGDLAGAIAAMTEAARLNPGAVHQRSNLASLYAEAGQLEDARRILSETLAAFPHYAKGWINLALVEQKRGDAAAAESALARAAQVRPLTEEERQTIRQLQAILAADRRPDGG
jgi:tetratricopeptide (TPR) repeat protein